MQILEENEVALQRVKVCYTPVLDKLTWEKTQKDFAVFPMLGPYCSLGGLLLGDPRLLHRRFGILEMHGGATVESCRMIDDGRSRGHLADLANAAAHLPADLDLLAAVRR